MIPGITTKISEKTAASAATITADTDLINLTGSTAIATIVPKAGGFSQMCVLVPKDGTLGLLTTGNISIAVTMAQNRATLLVYSKENDAWAPGAIS
jgi:hypothetical protein